MGFKPSEDEIEEAVDQAIEEIDASTLASGSVPRSVTIAFYEGIAARCNERVNTTKQERAAHGEGGEDDALDVED